MRTPHPRHPTHDCGGTILTGGSGEQEHRYCDRCAAYTYDMGATLPTGTDREANRASWDAGDERSPDDASTDSPEPTHKEDM